MNTMDNKRLLELAALEDGCNISVGGLLVKLAQTKEEKNELQKELDDLHTQIKDLKSEVRNVVSELRQEIRDLRSRYNRLGGWS